MTTAAQAERLVRKIAEAMAAPSPDAQTAKLAQDYADLCRGAARRLEQCALMIEAGQSLQALQLAETPPPLLDLVTILSFREATAWRQYCQTHQLPSSEPFYDKHLRQLNSAYGKGIAADHPYYRDYRRAVLKKNDERALSILRVIARMNPADENTTEELRRVEEKLLRGQLEKLQQALSGGDSGATEAQLARIEASGARVPPSNPIWQQAQIARCQDLIRRGEKLREQDAWQEAEALVDQVHSIATHNDLKLPAADADAWSSLEEWTSGKRRGYAADQDFQRAVSALEYEAQALESRRTQGSRPSLVEARKQLGSLLAKQREAERDGRPLPEELVARCQHCQQWLQRQMQTARLRRRVAIAAVVVVLLGGVAASIPSLRDWAGARDLSHRIAELQSARRVSDLEALIKDVPVELGPRLQGMMSDARDFIARERDLKQSFDQSLTGLQELSAANFRDNLDQAAPRRTQTSRLLDQLAPEFQPAGRNALMDWDNKWQSFRNAALNAQLGQAEQLAASLNGTNGFAAASAAQHIQSILAAAAPLRMEPPPLDASLDARYHKLADEAAVWAGYWERWQKSQAALTGAQTLDQYLDRLDQLAQSPFASAAQRDAAAEIDRLKINSETLLGELLLPGDHSFWDSLTNVSAWHTALMPEQPTPQEKDAYFKLRDDKNMQNVYLYRLVATYRPNNPNHTHMVFARGLITMDRGGQMAGTVYDPETYHDTVRFVPQIYSDWDYETVIRTNRTAECESFERIGLGDLIDPNTGNYQRPILQLLDQLSRDENSSGIFRAFVSMKLFDLARLRAEEWGINWCPGAARHLQALKDLGALDLKSGDWMAPVPMARYEAGFRRYFERARQIPLEKQAMLLQQLAGQVCQTDFSFAGFIDGEGHAVLRRTSESLMEYWGWGSNPETAALLLRKSAGGPVGKVAEPLPGTPLFIFNGDRRALLEDTARDVSYPTNQMAGVLPPFFAGLHE